MANPKEKPKRMLKNRPPMTSVCQSYDPNSRRFIAVHEAGHAVAAVVFGVDLKAVDIKRRPFGNGSVSMGYTDCPGVTDSDVAGQSDDIVASHMIRYLAGPFAEAQINPKVHEYDGHRLDAEQAHTIAVMATCNLPEHSENFKGHDEITLEVSPDEIERNRHRIDSLMNLACNRAIAFVEQHWRVISAIADLLVKRRFLTGEEVAIVVREHLKQ